MNEGERERERERSVERARGILNFNAERRKKSLSVWGRKSERGSHARTLSR